MKIVRVFMASLLALTATGAAALAATDDILMANDYSGGTAWVRDGSSLGAINEATYGSTISKVAYLPNGQMVLAFQSGTVQVLNQNFSVVASQSGFGTITALAVENNGDIVVGTANSTVWCRDSSLNPVSQFTGFGGAIQALAVQSNGNIAIGTDYSNGTVWLSNPSLTSFSSQSGFGGIQALAVQSNNNIVVGSQYLSGGVDYGAVWVRDASTLAGVAQFANFGGTIRDIAVQSNNDILIADDYGNGTLWWANPNLTSFDSMVNFGGQIRSIAVQSNDDVVIGNDNASSTLWTVNTSTKSVLAESANYGGTIEDIAVAPAPEPATLAILLFGGLGLLHRRKA